MEDLMFIFITLFFFALSFGLIKFFDFILG